jgi:hypothetical protein
MGVSVLRGEGSAVARQGLVFRFFGGGTNVWLSNDQSMLS